MSGGCVRAAGDRGKWLIGKLSPKWMVEVYTWVSGLHTANLVYFKGADGYYHCWMIDGYGWPVTGDIINFLESRQFPPDGVICGGLYTRQMDNEKGIYGVFPARGTG